MTTISPQAAFAPRPTPRKLGPQPSLSDNARDEYHRQLDWLVSLNKLDVATRDFLNAAAYNYSDKRAKDFYPSQSTMAEFRRCSRRTIQRRIQSAVKAGVLKVAQLKGFEPSSKSWYCSSNTHRVQYLPEWVAVVAASRAAKRDRDRQARIESKASPRGSRSRNDSPMRPEAPPVDLQEYQDRAQEAVPSSEVPSRAQRLRDALRGPQPPPAAL